MKQSPMLIFDSGAFPPEPGEDEAANPGIFGKKLAEWIRERLPAAGFAPGEVIAEDFGWLVPIESKPHALYVVCLSTDDTATEWRVSVFAEGGLIARLMGKGDRRQETVDAVYAAVRGIVEREPSARDLRQED
jgi:hypothetical protein